MTLEDLFIILIGLIAFRAGGKVYKYFVYPWILRKTTTDIEKNPKWITERVHKKYYGFYDIDIILAQCTFGYLPRLRWTKDDRLQILIPEDTLVRDIESVARVALAAKIKIKYGLWFPDKPIHWLAILCYMLDGGDIKESATSWEDKKPLDLSE